MFTHMNIVVSGRVHGVGFRMGARHKAIQLGLQGWVTNTSEGTVRIEVEGETEKIDEMIQWCKEGTPLSQVTSVEAVLGVVTLFKGFEIR